MAVLASPVIALVPVMAHRVSHGGARGVASATGLLTTAQGVGAVIGALVIPPLADRIGRGRVLTWALALLTPALVGYGTATSLAWAVGALVVVGAIYIAVLSGLSTVVQLRAPAGARGRVLSQYEGGLEGRAAAIEAGAPRPAAELVNDVRSSVERLEAAFDVAIPATWRASAVSGTGEPWPCWTFPASRRREVEVHLVDLGLGAEPEGWPADYVDQELPVALAGLDARLGDPAERARLLAWLYGRGEQPDLVPGPWRPGPADFTGHRPG